MPRALLATLALIAGCEERGQEPAAQSAKAASAAPEAKVAAPAIALDIEGLRVVDAGSGKTTPLAFGLPRDFVQDVVEKSTGIVPKTSSMGECPAGPMDFASFGALTLNFANGMFAGWSLTKGEFAPTTMDGIGIGTTRSEVEASRTIEAVEDSTLGAEFIMAPIAEEQNLSLIFDGPGPEARLETMWAGVVCNFR